MYGMLKKLIPHVGLGSTQTCEKIAPKCSNQCSLNIENKKQHNIDIDLSNTLNKMLNVENDISKAQNIKQYIEIESKYKNELDKRPLINIKINGVMHQALLDTGASISIFGLGTGHLWHEFKSNNNIKIDIKLPNGELVKEQEIKSIPIEFEGSLKKMNVTYSPTVLYSFIMGANFVDAFKLKICRPLERKECFTLDSAKNDIHIPLNLKNEIKEILEIFPFDDGSKLGCHNILRHKIDTGNNEPIIQHQYSYNVKVLEKIHVIIDDWVKQGVIEKSTSAWRNPIVVVKKSDGKIRVCLDARKLNSITKRDRLLTPNVFEALSSIPSDAKIFGRLDKNQAFLQTRLADEDKEKTAFFIKGRGLFHFLRMPFGLANAPATQTRVMLEIFGELEPYVLVYFDDIIVMGRDFQHYLELLRKVALKLRQHNLTISRDKMFLMLENIKILGHIVSADGIKVDKTKTEAINKWPTPTTKKELQRFIGMCNWYRRHIDNFSTIAAPMTELLKTKKFSWNEHANESFKNLKHALLSPPILRPPRWDLSMTIQCDASNEGIGAALTQTDENGDEFVIEYFSAKLTDNERKFSPTEKECLAVIRAIQHFRPYIELMELTIITDHYSLKYLLNMSVTAGRLARWILFLQPYVNCIQHRSGKLMKVADALSRAPIMNAEDKNDESLYSLDINTDEFSELISKIKKNPNELPNYRIEGQKVWYKTNFDDNWKSVPRMEYRNDIIQLCHEECMHGGIKCTLSKIREQWYWKRMRRDVRHWVLNCIKCASIKASNKKLDGKMIMSRIPKKCMEVLSVDIKGPFPSAGRQRYKYIVVVMDLLSRYTWTKMYNKATSKQIVKFLKEIFDDFEYPSILIHDNGQQFTSKVFKRFMEDNQIKSANTPRYSAKNNPVERFNRTLGESLSIYLLDHPGNQSIWHKFVDHIVKKLNSRLNEATGYTPSVVLYGDNPKIESNKIIRTLDENHMKLMEQAYHNSMKKFRWNQNTYNKDKITREIDEGEVVMTSIHKISSSLKKFNKKLAANYEPALIIKKIFTNAYQIMLPNQKIAVVDVSNIKQIAPELQSAIKKQLFVNTIKNCKIPQKI